MTKSEQGRTGLDIVLSFDVEEHDRIEAAAGLHLDPELRSHCRDRLPVATHWLLETLEWFGLRGTFFVVGQIAVSHPELVRVIHQAGHEVASHGWDHRQILKMTPKTFRIDLLQSRDVLQQVTGAAVLGYRAPTFSVI